MALRTFRYQRHELIMGVVDVVAGECLGDEVTHRPRLGTPWSLTRGSSGSTYTNELVICDTL